MMMPIHHIVDCTEGRCPSILVHCLVDDAEMKRVVKLYRQSRPHDNICAVLASDFDALVQAAGFVE